MLFTSIEFILYFLPITWILFSILTLFKAHSERLCLILLSVSSLLFYSFWNSKYLALLLFSLTFNYGIGLAMRRFPTRKRFLLICGVSFDLALLGYYKYYNFFLENLNLAFNAHMKLQAIALPLGISFFTFQQIAYRLELYNGKREQDDFLDYVASVTFFPHLIAGPIVYYAELIPQFRDRKTFSIQPTNCAMGILIFIFGLWKKNFADWFMAPGVTYYFDLVAQGKVLTFFEAWLAALSYTLQLYFDFSGYCDMAIGIALLFNIQLPFNFNSPYKARSLRDFWQRWHITLSRFIRTYVYYPLRGVFPRQTMLCILLAMTLSGLWHGAAWTFVVWGLLHAIFLIFNHRLSQLNGWKHWKTQSPAFASVLSWGMTFFIVVIGWVFFRADSISSAIRLLRSMLGVEGISLSRSLVIQFPWLSHIEFYGIRFNSMFVHPLPSHANLIPLFLGIVLFAPNIYELLSFEPFLNKERTVTPQRWFSISIGKLTGAIAGTFLFFHFLNYFSAAPRVFLYFNF